MLPPTPAVVLAAGLSRRLGRPKAMVQVNGRTVVRWVCDRLARAGCHPVVIVVNEHTLYRDPRDELSAPQCIFETAIPQRYSGYCRND